MRTFKYFLATLAFVTLISCSKDDDNPATNDVSIEGEWNLEEYNYTSNTSLTQGTNTVTVLGLGEAINLNARVIFNNDNTYQTEGSYTLKLTTTANGETSVSNSDIIFEGSGAYQIEGNKMILGNQQQSGYDDALAFTEATLVELTANRMVWSLFETVTTETEGMSATVEIEAMQVFSR